MQSKRGPGRPRKTVEINGETRSAREWAEHFGMNWNTVKARVYHGWSWEEALTMGLNKPGRKPKQAKKKEDDAKD